LRQDYTASYAGPTSSYMLIYRCVVEIEVGKMLTWAIVMLSERKRNSVCAAGANHVSRVVASDASKLVRNYTRLLDIPK
jgi:hypothetical protein